MKQLIIVAALFAAACAPQAPPTMTAKQESDFQKVIEGRTAGAPLTCISSRLLRGNKTYGEGVIVFEGPTSSVIYVNRPPAGCPELRWNRALKTRQVTDQLCSHDLATVIDPSEGIEFGGCTLGEFVPYRK